MPGPRIPGRTHTTVQRLAALGMGAAPVVGAAAGRAMADSIPAAATTQSVRDVLLGTCVGTLDTTGTTPDLAYQGSVNTLLAYHFVMRKK